MNANSKTLIGTAAMLALSAITAEAQITYLDADTANQPGTTNTTFADGSAFTPPMTPNGVPADNQWWERTGFANDSDILAVNGGSDAPVIRTTISGLTPGADYDVYVYYWWADPFGNGEWDLGAGFTQAGITHFLYTDGSPITIPFVNEPVLIQEGNRDMYEYHVGCTSASGAGTIDVYIDDHPGNDDRSWYDGVGTAPTNCGGGVGTNYCGPATPNSTGLPGVISATGSAQAAANSLSLVANQLPPSQFGYFLAGQTPGFFNPPNSQGIICLMGNIGRYNQVPNIIQGPTGSIQLDLTAIPVNPPQPALAGETWYFQCWYRDSNPGQTSNFTDGLTVTFF